MIVYKIIFPNKNSNKSIENWTNVSECARHIGTYPACIGICLLHPKKFKAYKNYIFRFLAGGYDNS